MNPKALLVGVTSFTVFAVAYVHYIQKKDIEDMRQGVIRDMERQRARKRELARQSSGAEE